MKTQSHAKRHRSSPKHIKKIPEKAKPQLLKRRSTGDKSLRKPPRVSEKFPAVFGQPKSKIQTKVP